MLNDFLSPYRAPELLFGPRTYDAFAIDMWSLGATFAEFFTPLSLYLDEDDDFGSFGGGFGGPGGGFGAAGGGFARSGGYSSNRGDTGEDDEDGADAEEDKNTPPPPFNIPSHLRIGYPGAKWARETLFNGSRGEIGLAWSIFQIRGTPNEELWPVSRRFGYRSRGLGTHLQLLDGGYRMIVAVTNDLP